MARDKATSPLRSRPKIGIVELAELRSVLNIALHGSGSMAGNSSRERVPPRDSLTRLPPELIQYISRFLSLESLINARKTCRHLYRNMIRISQATPLTRALHVVECIQPRNPDICVFCISPVDTWPSCPVRCYVQPTDSLAYGPHVIWDDERVGEGLEPSSFHIWPAFDVPLRRQDGTPITVRANSKLAEGVVFCTRCSPTAHKIRHREHHRIYGMGMPWINTRRHFFVICPRCTRGQVGKLLQCDRCDQNVSTMQEAVDMAAQVQHDRLHCAEVVLSAAIAELNVDESVIERNNSVASPENMAVDGESSDSDSNWDMSYEWRSGAKAPPNTPIPGDNNDRIAAELAKSSNIGWDSDGGKDLRTGDKVGQKGQDTRLEAIPKLGLRHKVDRFRHRRAHMIAKFKDKIRHVTLRFRSQ